MDVGPIEAVISAVGTVMPEVEEVISSPIDARVVRILAPAGTVLTPAQLLVELDTTEARLAVDRLAQNLALKENQRTRTRLDLEHSLAAFEERLVKGMQAVARDWLFQVTPMVERRDQRLRDTLTPVVAGGIIAGLLMLMVALGLTGVVWQNVTQRTREIGLRRAKGATIPDIRAQVLGELAVMSTIAILLGAAIVVQVLLLNLLEGIAPGG